MFKPLVILLLWLLSFPTLIEFSRNLQEWTTSAICGECLTTECQPYPHRLVRDLENNVFAGYVFIGFVILVCLIISILSCCALAERETNLQTVIERAHQKICKLQSSETLRGDRIEISVKKSSIEKGAFLFCVQSTPDLSEFVGKTLYWSDRLRVRIIASGPCNFNTSTKLLSLPANCKNAFVYKGTSIELVRLRGDIASLLDELNRRMIVSEGRSTFEKTSIVQ